MYTWLLLILSNGSYAPEIEATVWNMIKVYWIDTPRSMLFRCSFPATDGSYTPVLRVRSKSSWSLHIKSASTHFWILIKSVNTFKDNTNMPFFIPLIETLAKKSVFWSLVGYQIALLTVVMVSSHLFIAGKTRMMMYIHGNSSKGLISSCQSFWIHSVST